MSGAFVRSLDIRTLMGPASSAGPAQTPARARERRKETSTWRSLGATARTYVAIVTGAGSLALAASMPSAVSHERLLFVVLTALSMLTSMAKVSLPVPRSGSTLTVCYVFDFTALILLGPHAATVTAALGAWSQCTLRRREPVPFFQTWFSVGALALTVQATGYVYALLGGQPGLPLTSFHPEALIVASAVFFLVNSALVAVAVALSTGQSPGRVWMASYLWSWPGHLVGFALAGGASFGIGRSQLWLIPFSIVSLALTYENFKAYTTRFTDSVTDPLTGLANVRHLVAEAAQELARSKRDGMPMAVLVVDLDGFKAINDTYGHHIGDTALRAVGTCVQQSTRLYDVCARYGGDEFVTVLAGCDIEDAMRKASALRNAVAALQLQAKSDTVSLAISVGAAVFPEDGDTFEKLLVAADARMFADKEGRADGELRGGRRSKRERAEAVDPQLKERIMEAQRMEAVGQLAGGVAHDFNNALTAILGYSDLLTEQIGPDKPIGRDLKEIVDAAQHAASLTHQLLAFSRKQAPKTTEIDMNRVVTVADAMLRRLLGERIVIATRLADDLHSVVANSTQLEQIVVNLSVNARDAMLPAGGTLTLGTRNVEVADGPLPHPDARPGAYAVLSVTDTGSGMTPDVQAKIFEAFFTTKEVGKGTGLGLAAVQGIVSQLGGFVLVHSELNVGTTFEIFLPSTNHIASVRAAEPSPSVAIPAPVGLETILLVEDEAAVRQFATIALERHGYRVLEAHSAEAALVLLERLNSPVHLILTDVVLPGMDGRELAARIRQTLPSVPILFTTGYCDAFNGAAVSDDEELLLLAKPFTARALLEKTREVLDGSRVA